jgi:hypothetical protein
MENTQLSTGDRVTYKILDQEYYSRGYGINYETKTSAIVEICYKMSNGDMITIRDIEKVEKKEPKKETTS